MNLKRTSKKQDYMRLKVYMMCRKKTAGLRVEGGGYDIEIMIVNARANAYYLVNLL